MKSSEPGLVVKFCGCLLVAVGAGIFLALIGWLDRPLYDQLNGVLVGGTDKGFIILLLLIAFVTFLKASVTKLWEVISQGCKRIKLWAESRKSVR